MVIDIGAVKTGRFADVQADIAVVRAGVPAPAVLKVIIESAALTDAEILAACQAAVAAGADFVKTSTGGRPAGGATAHAVRLMKRTDRHLLGVHAAFATVCPRRSATSSGCVALPTVTRDRARRHILRRRSELRRAPLSG